MSHSAGDAKFGSVTVNNEGVARLNTATQSVSGRRGKLLHPILFGGAVAGILDRIPAFISFGIRAPQGVARVGSGAPQHSRGRVLTWTLGMLLHFFIAFTAATIYCVVGRKLEFLASHGLGMRALLWRSRVPLREFGHLAAQRVAPGWSRSDCRSRTVFTILRNDTSEELPT